MLTRFFYFLPGNDSEWSKTWRNEQKNHFFTLFHFLEVGHFSTKWPEAEKRLSAHPKKVEIFFLEGKDSESSKRSKNAKTFFFEKESWPIPSKEVNYAQNASEPIVSKPLKTKKIQWLKLSGLLREWFWGILCRSSSIYMVRLTKWNQMTPPLCLPLWPFYKSGGRTKNFNPEIILTEKSPDFLNKFLLINGFWRSLPNWCQLNCNWGFIVVHKSLNAYK